jgi:hypothetical protein
MSPRIHLDLLGLCYPCAQLARMVANAAPCRSCGRADRAILRAPRKYRELAGLCVICAHTARSRDYRKGTAAVVTALRHNMSRLYGLTLEQFDRLRETQQYRCAICAKHEDALRSILHKGQPGRLTVDHDHLSGRIRKLLCRNCNVVLGHAKDDAALLRAAADYIESFGRPEHHEGPVFSSRVAQVRPRGEAGTLEPLA